MKTAGKIALFVVSFAISALAAYYWWLKDWTLVVILMASILLHETGHWLVLRSAGLKPSMFFVPLLGAAVTAGDWISKLDHKGRAKVALAGPAVNFGLFLLGLVLYLGGDHRGMVLASLNASLVWFNLIPFLIFDGQKFASAIFASLNEEQDEVAAGLITTVVVVAALGLIIAGKLGIFSILIVYGLNRESTKDNPADARSRKAMSVSTATWLSVAYTVMLVSTMVTSAFIPFWTD